jgi:hypothetical protein
MKQEASPDRAGSESPICISLFSMHITNQMKKVYIGFLLSFILIASSMFYHLTQVYPVYENQNKYEEASQDCKSDKY